MVNENDDGQNSDDNAGLGGAGSPNNDPNLGWKAHLSSDLLAAPTIQNIKADSPEAALQELAKQVVGAQSLLGAERIKPLGDGASAEERTIWMQENMGTPKDAAEYSFSDTFEIGKNDKDEPINHKMSEETIASFRDLAFSGDLSQAQAASMLEGLEKVRIANEEASAKATMDDVQARLAKFSEEAGLDYKPTLDLANDAFQNLVPDELKGRIPDSLKNDPDFIKMFADFGKNLSDDQLRGSGGAGGHEVNNAAQALRAIADLEAGPVWQKVIANDANAVEKEAIMKQRGKLYDIAYPLEF
jgi:hypothetical protein